MQLPREDLGDRRGVVAQAHDPAGDCLVIMPRLLLGGAQAAPVHDDLESADDLGEACFQAVERGAERRAE
jgi:hypothetical protein